MGARPMTYHIRPVKLTGDGQVVVGTPRTAAMWSVHQRFPDGTELWMADFRNEDHAKIFYHAMRVLSGQNP